MLTKPCVYPAKQDWALTLKSTVESKPFANLISLKDYYYW